MPAKHTVAIVGGGIAGLTVAHELARTGRFDITVYEQNDVIGGKARSVRLPDENPGEHAMRVYLASYSTLYTVMKEIPYESQTAYDNLVYAHFSLRYKDDVIVMNTQYTNFPTAVRNAIGLFRFVGRAGVGFSEQVLFAWKIARILWMTPAQMDDELSTISFEDYMGGSARSPAFQEVVLRIPEMLVAAKRYASAAVVAPLLLEWYVGAFLHSKFHRLGFASLNGPTSERFLDPWVAELKRKGVNFRTSVRITDVHEKARLIEDVCTDTGETIAADIYVLAVQHNILGALLNNRLLKLVPNLKELLELGKEWSNGVQYFLKEIPPRWEPSVGRITVAIDSEWSLVFLITTANQLWSHVSLPEGTVGVLSAVMSNSTTNGRKHHKPYIRCTEEELLDEVLVEIGWEERSAIREGYIGPDLHYLTRDEFLATEPRYNGWATAAIPRGKDIAFEEVVASDGQLYIRLPGNLSIEPENATDVYNLFIAGEFTKTEFAKPTMEKSCESGMRCAYAVCQSENVNYDTTRFTSAAVLPFGFLRTLSFRLLLIALGVVGLVGLCLGLTKLLIK
jgi:uncharacterized protein with NAD-binding domain and iron-sulfur cluster